MRFRPPSRIPLSTCAAALLLAAASALPLAAQSLGSVRLKVTDERGAPVATALVYVDGRLRAWTDSAGRVTVDALVPGWNALKVSRIGLRAAAPGVLVAAGGTTELEVALAREPLALPGVEGKGKLLGGRPLPPPDALGWRIPRAAIAAGKPARLTDVLRLAPAVVLVQGPHGLEPRFRRAFAALPPGPERGGPAPPDCAPAFYVDGVLHPGLGSPDAFPPHEVEEVVLFPGNVPAEYNGGRASCGVVAIWTRGGAGAPPKPALGGHPWASPDKRLPREATR